MQKIVIKNCRNVDFYNYCRCRFSPFDLQKISFSKTKGGALNLLTISLFQKTEKAKELTSTGSINITLAGGNCWRPGSLPWVKSAPWSFNFFCRIYQIYVQIVEFYTVLQMQKLSIFSVQNGEKAGKKWRIYRRVDPSPHKNKNGQYKDHIWLFKDQTWLLLGKAFLYERFWFNFIDQ